MKLFISLDSENGTAEDPQGEKPMGRVFDRLIHSDGCRAVDSQYPYQIYTNMKKSIPYMVYSESFISGQDEGAPV